MGIKADIINKQWHKAEVSEGHVVWEKKMQEHLLTIFHSECGNHWLKWIDKHFRGAVETLALAKLQLEREAAGEGTAWGAE